MREAARVRAAPQPEAEPRPEPEPHPGLVERLKRHHEQAKRRHEEAQLAAAIGSAGFDLGTDISHPTPPGTTPPATETRGPNGPR